MDGRAVKVVPTWRGKELEVKTRPQNPTDSKFIKPGDSKFTKSKRVGTSVRNAKMLTVYPNAILDRLHLILLHHDGQLPHLWMQVGQHSQGVAD